MKIFYSKVKYFAFYSPKNLYIIFGNFIRLDRCDQTGEDITAKNFEYLAPNSPKNKPFEFDGDWTPPVSDKISHNAES